MLFSSHQVTIDDLKSVSCNNNIMAFSPVLGATGWILLCTAGWANIESLFYSTYISVDLAHHQILVWMVYFFSISKQGYKDQESIQ